jgi:hypothetical protein
MKQLPIAQCSGFLAYWNISYDKEEHLADDKSFISSLDILFNKELFPVLLFLVQNTQTSQAYSNVVLMKVRYIFDIVCLQSAHFSFQRTLTCLKVQLLYRIGKS